MKWLSWLRVFRFWLTLISLSAIGINISGHDDYNLLLAATSPLIWLDESFRAVRGEAIPIAVVYLTSLIFWYTVGYLLDRLVLRLRSSQR